MFLACRKLTDECYVHLEKYISQQQNRVVRMTEEFFRNDCYRSEFEAEVVAVSGELIILNRTLFYPGGGGQVCDTGSIGGYAVVNVEYNEQQEIVHRAPRHDLKIGDRVQCSVDWERRYDLMKGHTAEHLLFSALHLQDPAINIVKIFISPEDKHVVIDKDMSWDSIAEATRFANGIIEENRPVVKSVMSRNDLGIKKVRANLERIDGDSVGVVEIKGIDIAACCGIHVASTSEIGALFVYKKTRAGKDGIKIHFKIGCAAMVSSISFASSCLSIIDALGSKPNDIVKTVRNVRYELEVLSGQLKSMAVSYAKIVEPKEVNGSKVYSVMFPISDHTVLADAAKIHAKKGGVVVFVGKGSSLAVLVMSSDSRVDCKRVVDEVLLEFGGYGGGCPNSARGNIRDVTIADDVMSLLLSKVECSLN
ncbi:MAG: alanyl-tRNA editing protein [archaeon]|nr:alanyl-tRNA editing protein [archaeon]